MAATVHVKNISSQTTDQEVRDFFSFCGKISSLSVTADSETTKTASVTFEKEAAAKTALLLDSTDLGDAQVSVTPAASLDDLGATPAGTGADAERSNGEDDLAQEDKPRTRVLAEYLAHGYVISDKAIERAIALDAQHGISHRFTSTLRDFDTRFKASERAGAVDAKLGLSSKASAGWAGLHSYFDKAMGTPTGRRLRAFYDTGNKQVMDVHNEARHLADLKAGKQPPQKVEGSEKTTCACAGGAEKCGCAPGACACEGCGKNTDEKAAGEASAATATETPTAPAPAAAPATADVPATEPEKPAA